MKHSDRQIIESILSYCRRIEKSIDRYGAQFDFFQSDNDYADSVSMKMMQIGEIAKKLSPEFRAATNDHFHWKEIIGMRSHYAHSYSGMSISQIWDTAITDVPVLRRQCEDLLQEIDETIRQDEEEEDELEL